MPEKYNNPVILQSKLNDMPDFSNGQLKVYNTLYTAEEDGWIYLSSTLEAGNNPGVKATGTIDISTVIDSQEVYHNKAQVSSNLSTIVRVATQTSTITRIFKGQTYKMYSPYSQGSYTINNTTLIFYPLLNRSEE